MRLPSLRCSRPRIWRRGGGYRNPGSGNRPGPVQPTRSRTSDSAGTSALAGTVRNWRPGGTAGGSQALGTNSKAVKNLVFNEHSNKGGESNGTVQKTTHTQGHLRENQ